MGKEVINVATDKKSDCVVSNSDPADGLSSKPSASVESDKAINGTQGDENSHQGRVPCLRIVSLDQDTAENKHNNQKSLKSAASKPANAGNARPKRTVPKPFSLATEKRASGVNRVFISESTGNGEKPARVNDPQSGNIIRKTKSNSPRTCGDSCSISSFTAAFVRTSTGRTKVAIAPTFRSSERAEKRKEFHVKLEQKHQAVEAEKHQSEARTREEHEAALKEFRKSLVFKANPMPSFYHDGHRPKVDLKKAPPTRPKSPKFTRRKISSDANPAEGDNCDGVCGRFHRHSLGTTTEATKKLQNNPRNVKSKGLISIRRSSKPIAVKATIQTTTGVTVQT